MPAISLFRAIRTQPARRSKAERVARLARKRLLGAWRAVFIQGLENFGCVRG